MNNGFKLVLYGILVIATLVTGILFFRNFGKLFEEEKPKTEATAESETNFPVAPTAPDTTGVVDTNAVVATNAITDTNAVAAVTNASGDTNAIAEAATTNAPPETNTLAGTKVSAHKNARKGAQETTGQKPRSRIGLWTGSFVLCIIALGGLIAWDISNYMGSRALKVLYNDENAGAKDPEYEEAEKVWANGQHLEAVRMMRDYFNKNPREVHVALRIAEIYEKDLNNNLAAALEYEEVLKTKLAAERWGWAAIHLCNLYFKLGQEVKGYALLQRIVKDYGETQAAEKARKRLKEVDPNLLAEAEAPAPAATATAAPEPEEPKSNLPPGFRPKK